MGAWPVVEPIRHVVEPFPQALRMHLHRGDRLVDLRLPCRVAVSEEPLVVHDLHDRPRHAAAHDLAARLVHAVGLALRHEFLADLVLRDLDPHARVRPAVLVQDAAVEAGPVDLGLRLLELLPVPLIPDPQPLHDLDARQRPPPGRADDRHRLDRSNARRVQIVLREERIIPLEVPQGDEIVRGIGRDARDDAGASTLVDE